MKTPLQPNDVALNRKLRSWTRREIAGRALWAIAQLMFTLTPRPLWGARRAILRSFGARIGAGVHLYPTVRITIPWNLEIGDGVAVGDRAILYALGPITLGPRCTVSQGAHLCAGSHDLTQPHRPLIKPAIYIGADSWICADAFIGPGVRVGDRAIVGARGVVIRDVPDGCVVGGNPARPLHRSETAKEQGQCR